MSLFRIQPVYCSNCGYAVTTAVERGHWIVCSVSCRRQLEWKNTLYIMGKDYTPQPHTINCDENHAHQVPQCCGKACWCQP